MTNSNQKGGGKNAATKNAAADKAAQKNINVMAFENPEFGKVRTMVDKNGEPIFCGQDVCKALGYARTDNAVRQHVTPSDALKQCIARTVKNRYGESSKMQMVKMLFVNESGVYSLVFGSKLESAQRFKHWVTSEVLPAIRKNGGYFHVNPNETVEQMKARFEKMLREALAERDDIIKKKEEMLKESEAKLQQGNVIIAQNKALIAEQDERIRDLDKTVGDQLVRLQKSAEEILLLEGDIDRLLPKALYSDNVLDSISCYTTTQIAKEMGMTAQELNRELCARHIQYYQSGQYMLYAGYAHQGLAKSRTHYKALMQPKDADLSEKHVRIYTHTYLVWTERGRRLIHDMVECKC